MALNPAASWPSQTASPSAAYPYGEAQNIAAPGDGTGTPFVADLVNDIFGMQQALLSEAGLTPSGDPDEVGDSQYLDAMMALFDQSTPGSTLVAGLLQLSNDPTSTSTSLAATINAVRLVSVALTPIFAGDASNWSIKLGKIKIQGGTYTISDDSTATITFSGAQSAYTSVHLAFFGWPNGSGAGDFSAIKSTVVSSSAGGITNTMNSTFNVAYMSIGVDA